MIKAKKKREKYVTFWNVKAQNELKFAKNAKVAKKAF